MAHAETFFVVACASGFSPLRRISTGGSSAAVSDCRPLGIGAFCSTARRASSIMRLYAAPPRGSAGGLRREAAFSGPSAARHAEQG